MEIAIRYGLFAGIMLTVGVNASYAQTGAGSSTADNSTVIVAPGTVEFRYSETSYFGPDAHWEINGTLEIWSKYIWIAPTATFTGSGRIIIHDPATNPFYADMQTAPTTIDGNNSPFIDVEVELRNPHNLMLADINEPGYGTANPEGADAAALSIGNVFTFAVDEGDVLLNGHNLRISESGLFNGYGSKRMVVTGNHTEGHIIKTYGASEPFVFPLGIAEEDYTPAVLTPAAAATMFVAVQDYASAISATVPDAGRGMDRIWHIFADNEINSTYTLQHNSITNGTAFVDTEAEIVQYAGSGNWIGGATLLEGEGIHTRSDIVVLPNANTEGSWFTKLVQKALSGPEAIADNATAASGAPVEILILENDRSGSAPIVVASVRIVKQPANGSVVVNANGTITYTPNDSFTGEDTFQYEITDEKGMTAVATVTITVAEAPLWIPNVFTPNGDGRNDLFEVDGLERYDQAVLQIFNRWGNEVYSHSNYENNWDGSGLSEGTYFYILKLVKEGKAETHTGWVLIKY